MSSDLCILIKNISKDHTEIFTLKKLHSYKLLMSDMTNLAFKLTTVNRVAKKI